MAKRKRKAIDNDIQVDFHTQKAQEENLQHLNSQAVKGGIVIPQKRLYRQRPHVNVFADHNLVYPNSPSQMDWHYHFPNRIASDGKSEAKVEFADIGCGFGGLLFYLAPLFPEKLMVGMEIRTSVTQYVFDKIQALRAASRVKTHQMIEGDTPIITNSGVLNRSSQENGTTKNLTKSTDEEDQEEKTEAAINDSLLEEAPGIKGQYDNISALRVNAMKFLPNFFTREYAYILRPGGILYTITDVEDLHIWMVKHLDAFPLFVRLEDKDLEGDVCVDAVWNATEEGKKVVRNRGSKWFAAYRRIADELDEDSI